MGLGEVVTVFAYSNYREFLRDWFAQLQSSPGFSFRSFSRIAGFNSPNFVKLVVDGKRNLSIESAEGDKTNKGPFWAGRPPLRAPCGFG